MHKLLSVVLINLAVSCDNIGVIVLATQGLPDDRARLARRVGIYLSLALKLVFFMAVGYLFGVPWLHVRIIGGVLLLYVTYNMVMHHEHAQRRVGVADSFWVAIASILAADISMSLDNVLALMSVVVDDGGAIDMNDYLLIACGLAMGVPIMLWLGETVANMMARYPILVYICAGYLAYTAVGMILEDETIALFLEGIGFTLTTQVAVLCGAWVAATGLFVGRQSDRRRERRRRSVALTGFVVSLYAAVTVGAIAYLATGPEVHGITLSVERIFGFAPMGANAVYMMGAETHLLPLAIGFTAGVMMEGPVGASRDYRRRFVRCAGAAMLYFFIEFAVLTGGLTYLFGFGRIHLYSFVLHLLLQLWLCMVYVAVFCSVGVLSGSRVLTVITSMAAVFVENALMDVVMHHRVLLMLAGFLPGYYAGHLGAQLASFGHLFRVLFVTAVIVAAATYAAFEFVGRRMVRSRS